MELVDARPWGGPFAMVTLAELDTAEWRGLTRSAMLLMMNLLAECRGRNGWCMSSTVLNKRTGLSGRSHYRAVAELVAAGLLASQPRTRPDGGRGASAFTILVPPSLRAGLSTAPLPPVSGGPPATGVRASETFMNSQTMNSPKPPKRGPRNKKSKPGEVRTMKRAALASWMVSSWPFPSQHPVDALQAWAEAGYPADVVMVNEARGILGVLGWPRMRARTVAKLLQDIHGRGNVCSCGQVQSPQGFNVLCGACIETAGARTNGS